MKREIIDYFKKNKDEMIKAISELVSVPSVRGTAEEGKPFGKKPYEALMLALKKAESFGFKTASCDGYVGTVDLNGGEQELAVLAHLDVVPVTEDWTVTEPFQPKVVDGRIYGRGTADDKGPAIAALYALRAIRELGLPMKKSVRLILGSDEECGSGDLEYYYAKEQEAPYTFTPDADFPLINIEKGSFKGEFSADFPAEDAKAYVVSFTSGDKVNVVPARATLVVAGVEAAVVEEAAARVTAQTNVAFTTESQADGTVKVSAKGVAAHASTPAEGKNALTATLRLITALPLDATKGLTALLGLEALFPYEDTCGKQAGIDRENEESGALTLCFSIMDYTPEHLHAIFDARLPIGCTKENTSYPVKEALAQYGITLDNDELREPHCVPGDSWFVQTLLGSYERYFGKKGKALSTGGGTYVHELERGVAFGCMVPEVDNHMHGDDEFMEIEMLLRSAKIFADAILKICNAE